jgi:hypothetical protein
MKVWRGASKYERFHRANDPVEPWAWVCDGCHRPTQWGVDLCDECASSQTMQEWKDEMYRTFVR